MKFYDMLQADCAVLKRKIAASRTGAGKLYYWAGSAAFFLLYTVTPESFHSLMGPLGGVCLGFCTDYRYKTAMNCLGALMLAAGTYGLSGAVVLRVFDTLAGAVFGLVFVAVFHRLVGVRFLPRQGEPDRP